MNISWLTSASGQLIISAARNFDDVLIGITSLRKQNPDVDPQLISEAVTQAQLQKRLEQRWNIDAANLLLTDEGIMQATRPVVAKFRAEWVVSKYGIGAHVLDLTCGLGFDSLAFAQAGLKVTAIEQDPEVAEIARHNLSQFDVEVVTGNSVDFEIPDSISLIFVDPARRDPAAARKLDGTTQRIFNPDDWSPSWSFISELATKFHVIAKVAPGFDTSTIEDWDATWISADGDLVETFIDSQGSGIRTATLIDSQTSKIQVVPGGNNTTSSEIGNFLVVPDSALIRARALTYLAKLISGGLVNEHIAWLTSNSENEVKDLIASKPRAAMGFEILEQIKFTEKAVTALIQNYEASGITIMTRGVQLDTESLRKSFRKAAKPGNSELVVAIYRDDAGPIAFICRRLA